jgi:hypothetical protein
MKLSRDLNGNKTLKITKEDVKHWRADVGSGFSIQTLGNLPMTHNEGITFTTKNEVFEYINLHGTKRQKSLIGAGVDLTLEDFMQERTGHSVLFKGLTESDLDQIVEIIGGHGYTKGRIRSVLDYHLKESNFWGVASRFMYDHKADRWSYCAGQDYTYEMKAVRKSLLN